MRQPAAPAEGRAETPFVGLTHYTEERAAIFFGREGERKMIAGNLRASRLTLLYGESGVGKSSLLRAGVAAQLRSLADRTCAKKGSPSYVPVVFSRWTDDPIGGLVKAIEEACRPFEPEPLDLPADDLEAAIVAATETVDATLLIVLDQFEEYFLYHSRSDGTLADQFARCVKRPELRANFLISIRADAYAGLGELFHGRVPNVYGNYLRLEYLSRDAARHAIVEPIAVFNRLRAGTRPITAEPDLVEAVLDQVRHVPGDPDGVGPLHAETNGAVETTLLQLVMTRLWDEETTAGSSALRRETLERLGEVGTIIDAHVQDALEHLDPGERDLAAAASRFLVTSSGTKIALTLTELAELCEVDPSCLEPVLRRLAAPDLHILRPIATPDPAAGVRYEIFHDALARPIVTWRTRRMAEQRQRELEAELERARRAAWRTRRQAIVWLALGFIAATAIVLFLREKLTSERAALVRTQALQIVDAQQDEPLDRGLLLSLEACRLSCETAVKSALLSGLERTWSLRGLAPAQEGEVRAVAFSPDGKTLAFGGANPLIQLWNVDAGSQRALQGLPQQLSVRGLCFSRHGSMLAVGSDDGMVRLSDLLGRPVKSLKGHTNRVLTVACSPDAQTIASGSADTTVRLWDVRGNRAPIVLRGATGINSVAFAYDSRKLAAGGDDGIIRVWDVQGVQHAGVAGAKPLRSLVGSSVPILSVAFSPDGKRLAAGGVDGSLFVWDVRSGRLHRLLKGHTLPVDSVAFSPDGKTLASGSEDKTIRLWNPNQGTSTRVFFHDASVYSVAFSPDGRTIASASDDGTIHLWGIRSAGRRRLLGNAKDAATSAAFSPDGTFLAAGTAHGSIALRDGRTGRLLHSLKHHADAVSSVVFSPDGKKLASGSRDSTIRLWDVRRGRELRQSGVLKNDAGEVGAVAFGPDGDRLASGGAHGTIVLWDVGNHTKVRTFKSGRDVILSVALSPDGTRLAAGSADAGVSLWNAESGDVLLDENTQGGQLDFVSSVAFSLDGKLLASASVDGTVGLWDAGDGRHLFTSRKVRGGVLSVAFSHDGRTLVSGGADRTVHVWEVHVERGRARVQLVGGLAAPGAINSLALSGNDRLASVTTPGLALWSPLVPIADYEPLHDYFCGIVRRNLTLKEWEDFVFSLKYHRTCPAYPAAS